MIYILWVGFNYYDNYFTKLFSEFGIQYNINRNNTDLLFFSIFGSENINTIVLGYNEGWKTGVEMGKRNNQNFVGIPFETIKWYINYKSYMEGLNFATQEESYTSKCSSLDFEPIKRHDTYLGKRIKRGLFRSGEGKLINSDVNGSLNILRKAVPNVEFTNGIEAVAVLPKRIKSFK